LSYFGLPVIFLVTFFYAFALVLDRSAGTVYLALALLGLAGLVQRSKPEGKTFYALIKEYWPLMLAMTGPLIAVAANQLVTGHFVYKSFDAQFRLALFALVFWAILFVPIKHMKQARWGMILGVLLSTVKMYLLTDGGATRYGSDFIPIIIFAELVLLLGIFSIFSSGWDQQKPYCNWRTGVKTLTLCAAMYVAYLSQARGVWVTIPVFAIIACIFIRNISTSHKIGVAVLFALALAGASQFAHILKERVGVAETDIKQYVSGSAVDTSLGVRFQLWHGSWILFKEHPLIGVGIEAYPDALKGLAERKIISPFSATLPHSHNEILFMMARLGTFGLLAILAVYFVPLFYFVREIRHPDMEIRCAAAMGVALSLGFFTLGLVDVLFLWWESYPYYAISTAFFLCYIIKRKNVLAQPGAASLALG